LLTVLSLRTNGRVFYSKPRKGEIILIYSLASVQFLDGLLISVWELVVQELFDDGRLTHPSRTHHYHSSPNFHCRAAAAAAPAAAAVAASRLSAHRRQPDALLLLARHCFPLSGK